MATVLRGLSEDELVPDADTPSEKDKTPPYSTPAQADEYLAGTRSVARTMRIGMWIWPAYTLLDVYMCFVAYPQARFWLFVTYRVVIELAFFAVYRASQRRTLALEHLVLLQNLVYVSAAVGISLMALEVGGINSAYMHGISIVALVRTALVPTEFKRGARTYAGIAFAFPVVIGMDALLSPTSRAAITSQSLIDFASNYVFVLTSSFLGLVTGHIVWSAQERLYRARRVGRYRLKAPIGKGGMGEVWLAWDESLHRNVALKMLRVGATSAASVRRFEIEARAAGRLRGPHVIRIFDFGASEDGLYYIAMEYLSGMSVATIVEKFGPMPPARVVHLAIQACIALEEAHAAGVIHRDLKPQNLLVTHVPEEPDFVKLLDFGIARLEAAGEQNERLTTVGLMVGTPAYLAPELWFAGVADERSDIYAFGITLHVMLTGATPFDGWTLSELRAAHVSAQPLKLQLKDNDALTERLGAIIVHCLAWSADDRIQSARELRAALQELHDPAGWTPRQAEEFWNRAEKDLFSQSGTA